jgi:DNA polymerase-3 subunit chi
MSDIRFYHLERQSVEDALPLLVRKIVETGHTVLIQTKDLEETQYLDTHLWAFSPQAFLPHGADCLPYIDDSDFNIEYCPIFISHNLDNRNNANAVIMINGAEGLDIGQFVIGCELFQGYDPMILKQCRQKWKSYQQEGHILTYWQQDPNGRWGEKARHAPDT